MSAGTCTHCGYPSGTTLCPHCILAITKANHHAALKQYANACQMHANRDGAIDGECHTVAARPALEHKP